MTNRMLCDVDLDWYTYRCPCGASFCTRYETTESTTAWLAAHKPHTDGTVLEHTTPAGRRAWARPVPDEVRPL